MEMQTITFRGTCFCTVFVVQQGEVTILGKQQGTLAAVQEWLHLNNFPARGTELQPKVAAALSAGYYINPHMSEFYYQVDPVTNTLTAVSPQDFAHPTDVERRSMAQVDVTSPPVAEEATRRHT